MKQFGIRSARHTRFLYRAYANQLRYVRGRKKRQSGNKRNFRLGIQVFRLPTLFVPLKD
jgi:hypothetical protein